MPTWAVCLSILASETSALTFCSVPGLAFKGDHTYLPFVVGNMIGRLLVAFLFIPAFYTTGVTSIYEYLGLRFGPATRGVASLLFVITRILASGVRLTAAAIIVHAVTGWSFGWCVTAFTAITVLYTVYGGIKSIIWTDVLQFFLFVGGAALALFVILGNVGIDGFKSAVQDTDKLRMLDLSLSPTKTFTLLTALIGGPILMFATHGTDQDMVQRMLTAPDVRRSRRSLIMSGLADIPIAFTFLSIGVLLWVFYQTHQDPALPKTPNEIFCHYILYEMPVGLRGLLIAGIFATAMGSLSTAINALATSFTRDWYEPYINPASTSEQSLRAVRWATVWFSLLMIVVASTTAYLVIVYPKVRIIPIVLSIYGYTYGSVLGIFLAGTLTKSRGNDSGNIVAMIIGFIVVAILSGLPNNIAGIFGGKVYTQPTWLPLMEFPWWICFGTIVTFFIAILFRTGREQQPPGVASGQYQSKN
jgi:SSS family transporter